MLAYTRRNAAIATSVGAMAASLMLLIFFGAWAVSASSEANVSDVLAGAASGFAGSASPRPLQPVPAVSNPEPAGAVSNPQSDTVPRLASTAAGATPADTWWGKALLGACPLH